MKIDHTELILRMLLLASAGAVLFNTKKLALWLHLN